jgi:mannose-6-phosphate isomerase-like protein (cupin superfamily)
MSRSGAPVLGILTRRPENSSFAENCDLISTFRECSNRRNHVLPAERVVRDYFGGLPENDPRHSAVIATAGDTNRRIRIIGLIPIFGTEGGVDTGRGERGRTLLRVRLKKGGRIPPHTHPDERNSTVLSGSIYVGFGQTFDESKAVAVSAGAVYVAPANVPHYIWAKDGDAEYQEAGVGPTATVILKR